MSPLERALSMAVEHPARALVLLCALSGTVTCTVELWLDARRASRAMGTVHELHPTGNVRVML